MSPTLCPDASSDKKSSGSQSHTPRGEGKVGARRVLALRTLPWRLSCPAKPSERGDISLGRKLTAPTPQENQYTGPSWGPAPSAEMRKSHPQRDSWSQLTACRLGHDHQLGQLSLEGPGPVGHCKRRNPWSALASANPPGPEPGAGNDGSSLRVDSTGKGPWPCMSYG